LLHRDESHFKDIEYLNEKGASDPAVFFYFICYLHVNLEGRRVQRRLRNTARRCTAAAAAAPSSRIARFNGGGTLQALNLCDPD